MESQDRNVISMAIRHDGSEHFSFFCARCFMHFFNLLDVKTVSLEHNLPTIFIRLEMACDEIEGIKYYLDEVLKEVQSIKSRRETLQLLPLECTMQIRESRWTRKICMNAPCTEGLLHILC